MEEANCRGRACADTGVDLVWADLSNSSREPAIQFAKAMRKTHPNPPLALNYASSLRWSGDPNPLLFRARGSRLHVHRHPRLYASARRDVRRAAETIT
jgi:2-methylisocitrate lyase-like PEP mutase family enzyme